MLSGVLVSGCKTCQPAVQLVLVAHALPDTGQTETCCPRLLASLRAKFKVLSKVLTSPAMRVLVMVELKDGMATVVRMTTMAMTTNNSISCLLYTSPSPRDGL